MKLEEIGIECDISPTYKTGEQNMIENVFYKALDIYLPRALFINKNMI